MVNDLYRNKAPYGNALERLKIACLARPVLYHDANTAFAALTRDAPSNRIVRIFRENQIQDEFKGSLDLLVAVVGSNPSQVVSIFPYVLDTHCSVRPIGRLSDSQPGKDQYFLRFYEGVNARTRKGVMDLTTEIFWGQLSLDELDQVIARHPVSSKSV